MEPSKFHFYSFGTVAANKKRNSTMIQAFPQEKFTMASGPITDHYETIEVKGKDSQGKDYSGEIKTKAPLTCMWLPIGEPNRVTAPDVRRNEMVIIYRFADTDYYFWSTAMNDVMRKLETVAYWYSGDPNDSADAPTEKTADNGYIFQVSTHDKNIIISTSKANGEVCRYQLQLDPGTGNFALVDDLGNEILLDSVAGKLTATTENEIIHNTKKFTTNCQEWICNAETSATFNTPEVRMSDNLKVDKQSLFVGQASFTTGLGGGGYGDQGAALNFYGNVKQIGTWETNGDFSINGKFRVTGTGEFTGNITAPNI